MRITVAAESPLAPDLALLMARHTADMIADTPPESVHMMDASALAQADAQFFVLRANGTPAAMGAIKRIDPAHGEIKSMHVLAELRGHGYAQMMLDHLIAAARDLGFTRLSLETGTQNMFEPARRLYAKAGFTECAPFEGYREDPNSLYMTRILA